MSFEDKRLAYNKNFLEIVNRILIDTDGEAVETVEGSILDNTKKVCEWVNQGYSYCWKKIFQSTFFKNEGTFILSPDNQNDDYIEINANFMTEFDNLLLDGKTELKYLSPEEFNRKKYDRTGTPEIYTKVGSTLRVKPVSNEDREIYYYGTAFYTPLINNDDVPLINSDLLIAYGIFKQYCLDYNHIDNDSWYIFEELLKAEITALCTPKLNQQSYITMKVDESYE